MRYQYIDGLFCQVVDWALIELQWQTMMQIALSIQAGSLPSPLLLKKLGAGRWLQLSEGVRKRGDVVRTLFLLKWISDIKMRREVTSETNNMESYNGFAKWRSFTGDAIAQNVSDEQQKRLRYNDLITAAVILQNTVDMMRVPQQLVAEGHDIDLSDVGYLSPHMTAA